jgi:hypothetical protein
MRMARNILVVAVMAMMVAPGTLPEAQAQDAEDLKKAQALDRYKAGRKAYEAGDYQAAAARFEEAYSLKPNAKLLLYISQAHEQQGKLGEALGYLRRYAESSPEAGLQVANRLGRLEKEFRLRLVKSARSRVVQALAIATPGEGGGAVDVTPDAYNPEVGGPLFTDVPFGVFSTPPGASVYVDDKEWDVQGTTPYNLRLFPGSHQVWVEKEFYVPEKLTINVREVHKDSEAQSVSVELQREKVPVSIRTRPERAEVVYFDESGEARTLAKGRWEGVLPAGPARFIVRQSGVGERDFEEVIRRSAIDETGRQILEFNVRGDADLKREAMMATGTLIIQSYLTGGSVTIDGQYVGLTPGTLKSELSPGVHKVVVAKDGFISWVHNVSIRGKQETTLETPELLQPVEEEGANVGGWIFTVLGVGGLGAGGFFTFQATQDATKADDNNLISYICYGAGGASLLTGILFFALGGDDDTAPMSVTALPTQGGGGLVFTVPFE